MADNYKTPGVYINELSGFPPSVAEIASAIPVFIGYTEQATYKGKDLTGIATQVGNMMEYDALFGGAPPLQYASIELQVAGTGPSQTVRVANAASYLNYYMYHALEIYFDNGGSTCYVLSIGAYAASAPFSSMVDYLGTPGETFSVFDPEGPIAKEPDPTLIVMPDLCLFPTHAESGASDQFTVQQAALEFCSLPNQTYRFALLDLNERPTVDAENGLTPFSYNDPSKRYYENFRNGIGMNNLEYGAAYSPFLLSNVTPTITCPAVMKGIAAVEAQSSFELPKPQDETIAADIDKLIKAWTGDNESQLQSIWPQYKSLVNDLSQYPILLPPTGAVAGAYVSTDTNIGYWKAPANVSLNMVVDLPNKISDKEQEDMNVDTNAGKSINAIRAFTGKGILIWGARTMLGNDNDWRYVNVRRTASIIEESIRRSIQWAVFEPNDEQLWIRVKGMLDNYLMQKWRDGALMGSQASEGFQVQVGLGSTMTSQDILEGVMRVSVHLAIVRPAEFIVLTFEQQMVSS